MTFDGHDLKYRKIRLVTYLNPELDPGGAELHRHLRGYDGEQWSITEPLLN